MLDQPALYALLALAGPAKKGKPRRNSEFGTIVVPGMSRSEPGASTAEISQISF
jgi:hypothetical protein